MRKDCAPVALPYIYGHLRRPPTPPDSPGQPPKNLQQYTPELGLALVNFLRDQSAK